MSSNKLKSRDGSLFWILSLPLPHRENVQQDKKTVSNDKREVFEKLVKELGESNEFYQISFPTEFKVGTLDKLMQLGEEISRMDGLFLQSLNRIVNGLKNIMADNDSSEPTPISEITINDSFPTAESFLKNFQWNYSKYRADKPLSEICSEFDQEIRQIDGRLKLRMAKYNQNKSNLSTIALKNKGNLKSKDVSPYLKKDDFVDSEIMETVLVVVEDNLKQEWEKRYVEYSEMVVPTSLALIAKEDNLNLYSVVVFKKYRGQFCEACEKKGHTIRPFEYNEEEIKKDTESAESTIAEFTHQRNNLIDLLKTNFGEMFSAWIHVKVVILFVESVLKYGLPADFMTCVIYPKSSKDSSKSEHKLRVGLLNILSSLDLPGISTLDVASSIHCLGKSKSEETEQEAELWNVLDMASSDHDAFVKVPVRLAF